MGCGGSKDEKKPKEDPQKGDKKGDKKSDKKAPAAEKKKPESEKKAASEKKPSPPHSVKEQAEDYPEEEPAVAASAAAPAAEAASQHSANSPHSTGVTTSRAESPVASEKDADEAAGAEPIEVVPASTEAAAVAEREAPAAASAPDAEEASEEETKHSDDAAAADVPTRVETDAYPVEEGEYPTEEPLAGREHSDASAHDNGADAAARDAVDEHVPYSARRRESTSVSRVAAPGTPRKTVPHDVYLRKMRRVEDEDGDVVDVDAIPKSPRVLKPMPMRCRNTRMSVVKQRRLQQLNQIDNPNEYKQLD